MARTHGGAAATNRFQHLARPPVTAPGARKLTRKRSASAASGEVCWCPSTMRAGAKCVTPPPRAEQASPDLTEQPNLRNLAQNLGPPRTGNSLPRSSVRRRYARYRNLDIYEYSQVSREFRTVGR